MSEIHFISGPLSWYHFEFEDDSGHKKTIHLFSDIHDLTNLCPKTFKCNQPKSDCKTIDAFLEKVFERYYKNSEYLDFFLESPYRLGNLELLKKGQDSFLERINQRFSKCLSKNKKDCKYLPYVRMHYTDVRIPDFQYTTIGSFIVDMYDYLLMGMDDLDAVSAIRQVVEFIITKAYKISNILLTQNNFDKKINRLFEPLLKNVSALSKKSKLVAEIRNRLVTKIQKMNSLYKLRNGKKIFIVKHQLDQLKKDKVKYKGVLISEYILQFFNEYSKILSLKASQLNFKFWENFVPTKKSILQSRSEIIQNNILFDLSYLDIYILARMFRDFPDKSSTSIVYAGNLHIESQRDFFTLFMNLIPIHTESNEENIRCISNTNFNKVFLKN